MHTIEIVDKTARILDSNEKDRAWNTLQDYLDQKVEEYTRLRIQSSNGPVPAGDFFASAETFEEQAAQAPLEVLVDKTPQWAHGVHELFEQDQAFWELPYLRGRILLAGLEPQEEHVMHNLGKSDVQRVQESIEQNHGNIPISIMAGIGLYIIWRKENTDPALDMYESRMHANLASYHRRRAFYLERVREITCSISPDRAAALVENARLAFETYNHMFEDHVFDSEKTAFITIANLANALKIHKSPGYRSTGLAYYQAAREVLGDLPQIMEGIEWYDNAPEN